MDILDLLAASVRQVERQREALKERLGRETARDLALLGVVRTPQPSFANRDAVFALAGGRLENFDDNNFDLALQTINSIANDCDWYCEGRR